MDCSSKQGDCLFDSDPDNITILPGQVVSLDDQCKDFYGPTSGVCEVSLLKYTMLIVL